MHGCINPPHNTAQGPGLAGTHHIRPPCCHLPFSVDESGAGQPQPQFKRQWSTVDLMIWDLEPVSHQSSTRRWLSIAPLLVGNGPKNTTEGSLLASVRVPRELTSR